MKNNSGGSKSTRRKKRTKKGGVKINQSALYLLFAVSLLICLVSGALYGIMKNSASSTVGTISIYYYDPAAMALKAETRNVSDMTPADTIKFVLEELAIGPKNVSLAPSVPADIIRSAVLSGTNVDVSMSEKYMELLPNEEIVCRSAVAHTLTNLDFVESVSFNIMGMELTRPNGSPIGRMRLSDIMTEPDKAPESESLQTITLYFANEEHTELVSESRSVLVNPNNPLEKYIVEELIKGPRQPYLSAVVPPETVLKDVKTSDGICYVDFSKDFINRHTGGPYTELLSVYSIVNSLTEKSDVKNVQFYIEGERVDSFKSIEDFGNLFEARPMPFEIPR